MKYIIKEFATVYHEAVTRTVTVCNTVTTPGTSCPTETNLSGDTPHFSAHRVGGKNDSCRLTYRDATDSELAAADSSSSIRETGKFPEYKCYGDGSGGDSNTTCVPKPSTSETICQTYEETIKPAYYSLEPTNAWDSGADRNSNLLANGDVLSFYMVQEVNGVVVGLAPRNEGVGYVSFQYGFYCSDGKYTIMENGSAKTPMTAYSDFTRFRIKKEAKRVVYLVDNTVVHITRGDTPASLYVDCSLYSSGDTIYDATVVFDPDLEKEISSAKVWFDCDTDFEPKKDQSGGDSFAFFDGDADLNFLSFVQRKQRHDTVFPQLTSYGVIGKINGSKGLLPTLYSSAYSDLIEPQIIGSNGNIVGITTDFTTFDHFWIESAGTLPKLTGYSAPTNYIQSDSSLPALWSFGNSIPSYYWENYLTIQTPSFETEVTGTTYKSGQAYLKAPPITLDAFGSDSAHIDTPSIQVSATGTVHGYSEVSITVPSRTLSATMLIGRYGTAAITVPDITSTGEDTDSTSAYITLNNYASVNATLYVGSTASAILEYSGYQITGTGEQFNFGTADIIAPSYRSIWAYSAILVPELSVQAYEPDAVGSFVNAITMNINNAQVTEYTNYDFDNIITYDGVSYGVKSDGIYALNGGQDITTDISSSFTFSNVDYDSPKYKFKQYVYFGLRTGDKLAYTPIVDEVSTMQFPIGIARNGGHRVQIARGLKGRFWGATIDNVDGSDFQLHSIEEVIKESSRNV